MLTISRLMTRDVVTVRENAPLDEALARLERGRIRHLPVVRGKKLVGLLTHRELLRHHRRKGAAGRGAVVADAMVKQVTTVRPDASLLHAIRIMLTNRFGCLPVTSRTGTLVGIVTEADLLRVAADRVEEIDRRDLAAEYD